MIATLPRRITLLAAFAAAATLLGGCQGCDEEHPYTPFGIASSMASATPSATPSASSGAGGKDPKFAPSSAQRAPLGATRWQLDGVSLTAPKGRVFDLGLVTDLDQDGSLDAVAWTVPATPAPARPASPGQLWFFPAEGKPRKVTDLPGFIPTGPGCTIRASLAQTGPRTVTLDARAECDQARIARAPARAVVVAAPAAPRSVVLLSRVAPPAPGETLDVGVDSTDRDGDGRDDVSLHVTVQAQGSQRPATAQLWWLDRAAGPSQQPQQPRISLERQASIEQIRANGKNTSATVPDGVGNLRRLVASLCQEGGTPRVFDSEGTGLRCGELGLVVDQLAEAEVRAALTRKRVDEALAALARDGWFLSPISPKRRKKLEGLIAEATERVTPRQISTLRARPPARGAQPRWSPLGFEQPEPTLLVQTTTGLIRVSVDGTAEEPVEEGSGTRAWLLRVVAPDDSRFVGLTQACDRSELMLDFTRPGGPQPTRLLAARPGSCGGQATVIPPPAPIAFHQGRLRAVVAGAVVGPPSSTSPAARGGPRSPDGKHLVIPTPLGLLVSGGDRPELWHAPELDPWHALGDCVVAAGATRVACVKQDRVLLISR